MSHFSSIKSDNKLTNQEILVATLVQMGYENITSHEEPQPMQDYYQARGRQARSSSKANVIVPWQANRRKCQSDFGFFKTSIMES